MSYDIKQFSDLLKNGAAMLPESDNEHKFTNDEESYLINAYKTKNIDEFNKLIKKEINDHNKNRWESKIIKLILNDEYNDKNIEFFNQLELHGLNFQSNKYNNFLSKMIHRGFNEEWMEELIKRKININWFGVKDSGEKYDPPIFAAIEFNKKYIIDTLLKNNVDLEFCNSEGMPILNYFIESFGESMDFKMKISMTEIGLPYFDLDAVHQIPFEFDFKKYIKKLIEKGVDLNQRDTKGNLAFHYLAIRGCGARYVDLYDEMLYKGVDINSKNLMGRNALHLAVEHENHSALNLLIKKQSNLNMFDSIGLNPIFDAIYNEDDIAFQMLMDAGVDLSITNKYGNNIIHLLVANCITDPYFYQEILKRNNKLAHMKNKKGLTPHNKTNNNDLNQGQIQHILKILNKKY